MRKLSVAAALMLGTMPVAGHALELSDGKVRIGVLNDQSGTYSDFGGQGSVVAAQIAIQEFDPDSKGIKVELVTADHQTKPDVASAIARRWFEVEQVDAITDLTGSSVAIAINNMARDMSKITLMTGPGTTALTNAECSPTGFHWGWDTYSQSVSSANALLAQGFEDWFILTSDYAFGHQALGLESAQGLTFTTSYYWDRDDASRAFAGQFHEATGVMPGMIHAATYSAVLHYLKAVEAAGTDDAETVAERMRAMPVSDNFTQNGTIRADGRMITDMYLVKVKSPGESKAEWDYFDILATIPAEETAAPLEQSSCPFVE